MEVIDRDQHEENGCPKVFTVTAVNCFLFQVCLFVSVCFCLFLVCYKGTSELGYI